MKQFDKDLGEIMRRNREAKHVTLLQVAERLHVSEVSVHYWETGKRQINASTLKEYCAVLGITIQSVFDEMDGMHA